MLEREECGTCVWYSATICDTRGESRHSPCALYLRTGDAQASSCLPNQKQKFLCSMNGSYLKRSNIHVEKRWGVLGKKRGARGWYRRMKDVSQSSNTLCLASSKRCKELLCFVLLLLNFSLIRTLIRFRGRRIVINCIAYSGHVAFP